MNRTDKNPKDTLILKHTKLALQKFDRKHKKWDKIHAKLDAKTKYTNKDFELEEKLMKEREKEIDKVRKAFYQDTKDRNCLENCMIVPLSYLRESAAKYS